MSNAATTDRKAILKEALQRIQELEARLAAAEQAGREPLAVIGLGCRYPGGVNSPESYWQLLRDGVDAITEIPPDRFDINAYYDPDHRAPGKVTTRWGGYLSDIDKFDPHFFGISPREAVHMDPQHRLLLQVVWEALEHAGQAPDKLHGSNTGVFVGITTNEYLQLHYKVIEAAQINAYLVSNNVSNVASGRIAFHLGLHGPAISVDTACSSSLVATYLACQSLRSRECDMAIVGGVNVILSPETLISFSKWGMMSPSGRCRTFDAGADGFVRSEGCGAVILKRLSDALANNDNILAVIRGVAANQDGPSSGISVPNGPAQEAVIRRALANAGIAPALVGYVETHGTGTTLGDPIEVEALGAVYREGRSRDNPLRIGAVKTNLGHMESASGLAGLIKTVLVLQHEEIPPHLHLQQLTPHIAWERLPIEVPRQRTPWPRSAAGPARFAGVSGFGFSGTNVHVILEEAPPARQQSAVSRDLLTAGGGDARLAADSTAHGTLRLAGGRERPLHLLTLSAREANALEQLAARYQQHFAAHPNLSLPDVCYTAGVGRARFTQRLAVVAGSLAQAADKLADFVAGRETPGLIRGEAKSGRPGKLAFLYCGQGYQHAGMGRQLFETQPTFRRALETCDELFRPYIQKSLLAILYPETPEGAALIDQTIYTQPAMFSLQYALTQLWLSWGLQPAVVMGHSLGEFMAAHLAGMYRLEDAVKLVATRGLITQDLPAVGKMASVQAGEARVRQVLAPHGDKVCIAAINGPDSVVISGITENVEQVLQQFEREGVNVRRLAISNAFHSPFIEPALEQFTRVAEQVKFSPGRLRVVSTLTGQEIVQVVDANYWRRHLREPVQFHQAMQTLYRLGCEYFVELGPNPTLLGMARRFTPEDYGHWFASLRKERDDWQQLLESAGGLFACGVELDWQGFDRDYHRRRVELPTYPFQNKRYWIASGPPRNDRHTPLPDIHPLLQRQTRSPLLREIVFESQLSTARYSYFADHQVHGLVVLPLTGYLEMVLAGAQAAFPDQALALEEITLHEPLVLAGHEERTVQLLFTPETPGIASFQVISLTQESKAGHKVHVTGRVAAGKPEEPAGTELDAAAVRERCREELAIATYYQQLAGRGLQFGPQFRGLQQLWRRDGEAFAHVQPPEEVLPQLSTYQFHPALLDACLQAFVAGWPAADGNSEETYLPLRVESYRLPRRPTGPVTSHIVLREAGQKNRETYSGDVTIHDGDGRLVAELRGVLVKRTNAAVLQDLAADNLAEWLYEIAWRPKPLATPNAATALAGPGSLVPQVQPLLPQLRATPELAAYEELLPQLDALCLSYVQHALHQFGCQWQPRQRFRTETLAQQTGVIERHRRLLHRLLEMLAEDGVLQWQEGEWVVQRPPVYANPETQFKTLLAKYPASSTELALTGKCGQQLARTLRGEQDPLPLLFPGGSVEVLEKLYQNSPITQAMNRLVAQAVAAAVAGLPKDRKLRVLEIGAGTGGTTAFVLPLLPVERTEYFFTDVSPLFLNKAQDKFRGFPFVQYRTLDIEAAPQAQGFAAHAFDLIIAANVLHATADLRQTLQHVRQLLASQGLLVLLEGTERERWVDLTFGLTEGWWKFRDHELRPSYALLSKPEWLGLLEGLAFSDARIVPAAEAKTEVGRALAQHALILARGPQVEAAVADAAIAAPPRNWLILADQGGVGERLATALTRRQHHCVLAYAGSAFEQVGEQRWQLAAGQPEDFLHLLQEAFTQKQRPCQGVIHLWSLDAAGLASATLESLQQAKVLNVASVLHLVQAMIKQTGGETPALWLVTRGAQAVGNEQTEVACTQAPVWGLARVIALEHPELRCKRIDLDPAVRRRSGSGSTATTEEETNEIADLLQELFTEDGEELLAWRGRVRHVARLIRHVPGRQNAATVPVAQEPAKPLDPATTEEPVQLQMSVPGVLDSLSYRRVERRPPGPGEVEIRVRATGLNFRDVLNALGMYPGDAGLLGGECAGEIVALGEGVSRFQPGQEVMGIAAGSFSNYVTTAADLLVAKPEALSFAEACTIPSAFMTAYYTLIHLGRLAAGERVLIHSAGGGVGLAAVQLAQRAGAIIFATAGSGEKRERLRELGVRYVMDSRSLDFAHEIMQFTDEEGVDVVLNSLSGEFIPTSLSVLKDDGRFLEIGKREIWSAAQVNDFKRVGAYHVVDLAAAAAANPGLIREILAQVMAGFADGHLRPLPFQEFPSHEVVKAFRLMQSGRHFGKIVVSQQVAGGKGQEASGKGQGEKGEGLEAREKRQGARGEEQEAGIPLRSNATYLITGGLAGLGLLTAQWLVERGVRHLVLMGRSGASESAREKIAAMEQAGAQVMIVQGDVSQPAEVARLLTLIREKLPPLRGLIHSVGVLDDGALLQQNWQRFSRVLGPKIDGAWLLHQHTTGLALDFFILYSSMSSVLGQRGQGNHAAANAFLDSLAQHRRRRGLAGMSIHWGAWSEIGAAAARQVGEKVSSQGIGVISPQKGLAVLESLLAEHAVEVGVLPVNWQMFARQFQTVPAFYSELVSAPPPKPVAGAAPAAPSILQQLAEAPAGKRRGLLASFVREQAAKVLGLEAAHPIDKDQPLQKLGLDSLMAVELRNLLGAGLGGPRSLPATLLFDYPSINAVTDYLAAEVLRWETADGASNGNGQQAAALRDLQQMSDAEAEALLLQELEGA
ncbi:MAG: SDR family NAD(P)-dependent oxidoreductase [candidate division KSB1 bacterium]|nr:SDR family NAD(P)-dependent oxidoreductase [candidate division KSB1 bacterium]MDZ7275827.1 SDR family NAD(P)-dependent oxidoreductase [candidate division KSB1 bacterium]MDZ7287577.1 SDR family NAD(P)-dependent oxidoreductase [candidate division KSB1 bacterium]MDZ7307503.1 SDR family NAD(P)-dependent oxidoreductase [candidate division KSB1 bacterium]MDZ7350555.1 SDR family NAD(P)-dependent oxidoreductase [candidate division KSB1 bacterium]